MRSLVLVLTLCFVAAATQAQPAAPVFSEVRITLDEREDLHALAEAIPGLGHVDVQKTADGFVAVAVLDARDLDALSGSTFAFEVTVPDVAAAYRARPQATEGERAQALAAGRVGGFGYGSMGGYYTFDEVVGKLDELAATYPDLITERVSIGQSWEGRELWMVKISDNPTADESEPEVLYTGLHHAREPQSMTTVLYTMYYLLENYGTDPEVTYLVDNRELYFIPVLNPDGYVFNETTNPNGGGFWRKNRRDNGGNEFGVDLNRNYSYEWGRDNSGSSPNPGGQTYRGPAPFSEPETAALRDFALARDFRAAFNYHSYSNVLLHSWGYERGVYTPDQDLFTAISAEMTRVNGYPFGQAADVLYPANGDSDDWHYGELDDSPKTFAWTPEVGSAVDGFWPEQNRIIPLADENIEANLVLAWFAGAYPAALDFAVTEAHAAPNGHLDPGEPALLSVTIQNLGLDDLSQARARVVSTNPDLPIESGDFGMPFTLGSEESVSVGGLTFTLGTDAAVGVQDGLAVEIEFDGTTQVFPLDGFVVGTPMAVFEDDAVTTEAWDTGTGWGLSSTSTSPPTSFADSPAGDYPDDAMNALTLTEPLDLSGTTAAQLRFMARWDIEAVYDFVQVRASTDGAAWTPLIGRHTRLGTGFGVQTEGEPGYDGTQTEWVLERMDLSAFAGEPEVYLQVRLRSDGSVNEDGFYLDDFTVETFVNGNTVASEEGARPGRLTLHENYPNPFAERTQIPFDIEPAGPASLVVYDVLGQRVRVLAEGPFAAGRHSATWDGRDEAGRRVASGVYLCVLRAGDTLTTRKLLVVR
jgi:carboxypeptidase T